MNILYSLAELESYLEKHTKETKGFAPTMGALHAGHLSLYALARQQNDLVLGSIFVNPTQFNNPDDLKKYPRTEEKDLELLQNAGVDAVYLPRLIDLYPQGLVSKAYDFGGLDAVMEGPSRPGHFNGVGTVVETLIRQVRPTRAYFGEKDFQQLAIIRKLVEVKSLPVEIIGVPTLREESGLAMSSRNMRLTQTQQKDATLIYHTLLKVKEWFRILSIKEIKHRVESIFAASCLKLEYFSIAEEESLKETDFAYPDIPYRAFLVAWIGDVRLIDNLPLD